MDGWVDKATFQLMKPKYDMSLSEWYDHFGFFNADAYVHSSNRCLSIYENTPKESHIDSHAIRYL
jgi:hypothetical protein